MLSVRGPGKRIGRKVHGEAEPFLLQLRDGAALDKGTELVVEELCKRFAVGVVAERPGEIGLRPKGWLHHFKDVPPLLLQIEEIGQRVDDGIRPPSREVGIGLVEIDVGLEIADRLQTFGLEGIREPLCALELCGASLSADDLASEVVWALDGVVAGFRLTMANVASAIGNESL
jgi:hypothetical protein